MVEIRKHMQKNFVTDVSFLRYGRIMWEMGIENSLLQQCMSLPSFLNTLLQIFNIKQLKSTGIVNACPSCSEKLSSEK